MMHKKNGNTLVEALIVISIVGLIVANLGTISSNAISKAKWSQAENLQYQVNKTYSNWVQLGGTHTAPSMQGQWQTISNDEDSFEFRYVIRDDQLDSRGRISWNLSITRLTPRVNGSYYMVIDKEKTGRHGSVKKVFSGTETFGRADLPGTEYVLRKMISLSTKGDTSLLTLDATKADNLTTTENIWTLLADRPSNTPAEVGDSADYAKDSDKSIINSSSVRLGSVGNAEVEIIDGGIVYNEEFRLEFTPTSNNSGFWIVSYTG